MVGWTKLGQRISSVFYLRKARDNLFVGCELHKHTQVVWTWLDPLQGGSFKAGSFQTKFLRYVRCWWFLGDLARGWVTEFAKEPSHMMQYNTSPMAWLVSQAKWNPFWGVFQIGQAEISWSNCGFFPLYQEAFIKNLRFWAPQSLNKLSYTYWMLHQYHGYHVLKCVWLPLHVVKALECELVGLPGSLGEQPQDTVLALGKSWLLEDKSLYSNTVVIWHRWFVFQK